MITVNTSTLNNFNTIDWTFSKDSSNGHITSLHPYPARFIPKIPRTIFENLDAKDGLNILDPFAGCGTTLYEGLEKNNRVVGIDINPLAILLQRVYTYPYKQSELAIFKNFYNKIAKLLLTDQLNFDSNFNIPNISHWFGKEAINVLATSITLINNAKITEELKDLFKFSLSRIIVKISNQQSDTQYRAVNKELNKNTIINIVVNSFKDVEKAFRINERNWKYNSKIILGDSRSSESYKNVNSIDIVITSPPYPNAYEYWLYHKYRMYWLDLDPIWCRKNEIGARPFYSGSGKLDENDFQKDMEEVFENLYRVSHANTVQFWVVGSSIIKGKLIDNTQIIGKASSKHGWKTIGVIKRNLMRSKSSFQGIGRQKEEEIVVLVRK